MKKCMFALLGVLLILVLAACQLSTGSIEVSIAETVSNKTLLPAIDMDIAYFAVHGEGPEGEIFDLTAVPGDTVIIDELSFGTWLVGVEAYNAGGELIGAGKGETIVNTGETSFLTILVTPLGGKGAIDLTVNWTADDIQNPSIYSEIIPAIGNNLIKPNFTITGSNKGTYLNQAIDTGYHTVIIQLLDNEVVTMGSAEVARIVRSQTTYGVYDFYSVNEYGGSLFLEINPDMNKPIDVKLLGGVDYLYPGESMTLNAVVPDDTGNTAFMWYINGFYFASGSNMDDPTLLFEGFPAGFYRIDVTAFTADGKRGGSASHFVTVLDKATFSGEVGTMVNGEFKALEGVQVGVGRELVLTDRLGRFFFWDWDLIIIIRIEFRLPGYLPSYKPVVVDKPVNYDLGRIVLLPAVDVPIPAGEPIKLESPSGTVGLLIPPDSLEYPNGEPYKGDVIARMNGITPAERGFDEAFIGNYEGVRLNGETVPFESFGFLAAEFTTPDGKEPLQLRQDTEVEMTARISDPNNTPEMIPTWTFDTDQALWLENADGDARLEGDVFRARLRIRIRIRIRIIINIDLPIIR